MHPSTSIAFITFLVAPVALAHSYDGRTYYERGLSNAQFSVIQARNILDAFYAVVSGGLL
ncbi:hypothetical protein Hypma_004532 [Hypsizygus marmoreus]|uniref:Uncharacterized protein n=1 Tax=Hypsizygus marmoreus TaxID=39966 RepID=A0A369K5W2_HYPMA|nr:hypothetical protein Hypma_004532 [Hypsizygus marmoreus]